MSGRVAFERGLRLIGFAALAAALVLSGTTEDSALRVIRSADLPGVLSKLQRLDSILVVTDTALDPVYRDWLAAERVAGRGVRWGGKPVPATAVSVEPLADPAGGSRVLVAAPDTAIVRVADSLGVLDSVMARHGGIQLTVPTLVGGAAGATGGQTALGRRTDSLAARRIVVFGAPSWETKFVIAVLEERGWQVDARVPLSPDTAMVQGASGRLDTSRVAAVVALDRSAARHSARIETFVRSGGGLVLGPDAASDARFARVRVGAAGARQPAPVLEVEAREPRRALALVPVVLAQGAVPLERRDAAVAVAARRVGPGRVAQLGYEDTWRWRMAGPDGSVEAHRLWWSAVVASVAYRPALRLPAPDAPHDAPLARMVARLGPGDSVPDAGVAARGDDEPGSRPEWWILAIGLAALVSEWASRRLRGAT